MKSENKSRIFLYLIAGLIVTAVASTSMEAYSGMTLSVDEQKIETVDAMILDNERGKQQDV